MIPDGNPRHAKKYVDKSGITAEIPMASAEIPEPDSRAAIAQLGERQTEDLEAPSSWCGQAGRRLPAQLAPSMWTAGSSSAPPGVAAHPRSAWTPTRASAVSGPRNSIHVHFNDYRKRLGYEAKV